MPQRKSTLPRHSTTLSALTGGSPQTFIQSPARSIEAEAGRPRKNEDAELGAVPRPCLLPEKSSQSRTRVRQLNIEKKQPKISRGARTVRSYAWGHHSVALTSRALCSPSCVRVTCRRCPIVGYLNHRGNGDLCCAGAGRLARLQSLSPRERVPVLEERCAHCGVPPKTGWRMHR
jgi:hypothetical protein